MKRWPAAILALVLVLSCCTVSLAKDPFPDLDKITGPIEYPTLGIRFEPPEVYRNTAGVVVMAGPSDLSKLVDIISCDYYAMTDERYAEYTGSHELTIPLDELWIDSLFTIITIRKGMTFSQFNTYSGKMFSDTEAKDVREIGRVGDTTYYLFMQAPNPDFVEDVDPAYLDEYVAMREAVDDVIAGFSFFEAVEAEDPYAGVVGTGIEFTTTDLDGNPVSSADLFAQSDVTLVNFWATWCAPCIGELEDLQSIHTRKKGVQVIGILIDDDLDAARELLDEFNVSYPVILAPGNLDELFPVKNLPTSIFAGPDGTILAEPVIGAMVERYHTILNELSRR